MRDARYIEIPGNRPYELPPLLVHSAEHAPDGGSSDLSSVMGEAEDMLAASEITFECEDTLRSLLHPDVWPHASRSSFVTLLADKHVPTHGVALEKAVGLRLTFRQPPPIDCFSNQFLFYLNSTVADSAYHTWSHLIPEAPSLLPPERFHFDVVDIGE